LVRISVKEMVILIYDFRGFAHFPLDCTWTGHGYFSPNYFQICHSSVILPSLYILLNLFFVINALQNYLASFGLYPSSGMWKFYQMMDRVQKKPNSSV
jgi:hypothetical protein